MPSSKKIKHAREFWDSQSTYNTESSVLDPADTLGRKNQYIRQLSNTALEKKLKSLPAGSKILDFGCGTGQNFAFLERKGYQPIGIDISYPLLKQAVQQSRNNKTPCIQYDGQNIPLKSNSFPGTITYGVFIYLVDDNDLITVLTELHRILQPGAFLLAIEQIAQQDRQRYGGVKTQRSKRRFNKLCTQAGFKYISSETIRRGHFPLIYFVRYGMIPQKFFRTIAKIELWLGRVFPNPTFDYAETLFVFKKDL